MTAAPRLPGPCCSFSVSGRGSSQIESMTRSQGMPARSLARLTADGEGASNMHSTSSSSRNKSEPRYLAPCRASRELFAVARAAIASNSVSLTPGQ